MANISHFTQTVNGVSTTYDIHDANAIPRSGGNVLSGEAYRRTADGSLLSLYGGTNWDNGAFISLSSSSKSDDLAGSFLLQATTSRSSYTRLIGYPNGTLTWGSKNLAMQEDVVPRGGGTVITGSSFSRTVDDSELRFEAGSGWNRGGAILMFGKDHSTVPGQVQLRPSNGTNAKSMFLQPDGTWTWSGTACQITSDQRLKQQIDAIDDKLLDAWEDVNLVQFKYNDAVEQKGDNARLHTGYVVQQIDKACQSRGVDISNYGLFCHEEYPEETEEVTIENEDGTTTKETKVIEPASEHYSLRYTETLVVECAYLRRENARLKQQMQQYSESLSKLEERLKALEQTSK